MVPVESYREVQVCIPVLIKSSTVFVNDCSKNTISINERLCRWKLENFQHFCVEDDRNLFYGSRTMKGNVRIG
jgi:hypothetical protein